MQPSLKTRLIFGALLASAAVSGARADEALRKAQQALHEQGFYYGTVDGTPGDETTQAVRRYQIRNGLAVTGQLNDETLKSIAKAGAPAPARAEGTPPPLERPEPPPATISGDDEAPAPTPVRNRPGLKRPPVVGVAPGAVRPSATLMDLFAGTPYEFAPPPVQADIVKRAQFRLVRSGFYGGDADGIPGDATAAALSEFQSANGLRRSGRLTAETLEALHLAPPPRRAVGPPRGGGPVFEGRVVR